MSCIELDKCIKKYYLKSGVVNALNKISYKFEYGKFYAIMGQSGSGKSTLIHILGCLEEMTSGTLKIDNKNINKMSEKEKNFIRNRNLGFVFQSFYLNNNLNALENVLLPSYINKKISQNEALIKANELLKRFGLSNRVKHYPNELSGGEQQRVAIARALMNDPHIILADEPTGSLDEKNEQYIFEELKKLSKEGKCVIVVSHNPQIKKYADVVLNIKSGKLC